MTKEELKRVIVDELLRQEGEAKAYGLKYCHIEDDQATIDGQLNLDELCDAILKNEK